MKLATRLLPFASFIPMLAFAQGNLNTTWLTTAIQTLNTFINTIIPFIFAIALLVFIWGVFVYFVYGGADEGKRESGKQFMIWGLLGFVIMASVWGIVNVLIGILGLGGDVRPAVPVTGL